MQFKTITSFKAALLLLVSLSVTLAACSPKEAEKNGQETKAATTLSAIKEHKLLTAGVKADTPPYGFVPQGQSEPEGFDIDIVKQIAERMGVKLNMVVVTSANRIANLTTKKVDMLVSSLVHTRKRDEAIDFSVTYFADSQKILVPQGSPIKTVKDLTGKRVAVGQGSIQEQMIKVLNPDAKILSMAKWSDTLQAITANQADAIFSAAGVLGELRKTANNAGMKLAMVGKDGLGPIPYAIGIRQGDADLRDEVNRILMDMVEDGTYEKIFKKWWGDIYSQTYQVDVWPK